MSGSRAFLERKPNRIIQPPSFRVIVGANPEIQQRTLGSYLRFRITARARCPEWLRSWFFWTWRPRLIEMATDCNSVPGAWIDIDRWLPLVLTGSVAEITPETRT